MAFYKGFLPNFTRLGTWNVVMFLTLEQVNRLFFYSHFLFDDDDDQFGFCSSSNLVLLTLVTGEKSVSKRSVV